MLKAVCVFDTGGKLRAQCQTSVTSSTITSWHTLIIENHEWSSHGVTALQSRLQFSRGTRQQARTCDRLQLDPLVSSEQTTNPPVRVIYNLPKPDIYASADAPDLTPPRGAWNLIDPAAGRRIWKQTYAAFFGRRRARPPRATSISGRRPAPPRRWSSVHRGRGPEERRAAGSPRRPRSWRPGRENALAPGRCPRWCTSLG